MTTDIRFVLFGGPHDGAASSYPSLPASLWIGPCDCRRGRPCGGINAYSDRAVGDPRIRAAVRDQLVEYKRDGLMPDGRWRYVYADVEAGPVEQIGRDRELVPAGSGAGA